MFVKNEKEVVKTSYEEIKEVFGDYTPKGLETVLENKENALDESENKEEDFISLVNEDGFTIALMNGETILGGDLFKMVGFKSLCTVFSKDYEAFDDLLFSKKTLAYGEQKTVTNYERVDTILEKFGMKRPTTLSKTAIRNFRNIFWTARRHYKMEQLDNWEIKYLKDLIEEKKQDNDFDMTSIEDYLEDDLTNINFFDLE